MSSTETKDQTYEGWTNYATWGVKLVLDNDQGTYSFVNDHVAILSHDVASHPNVVSGIWTEDEAMRFDLVDWLKELVDELCGIDSVHGVFNAPEPSLMARQVIHAGLAEVDWDEIADAYLTD